MSPSATAGRQALLIMDCQVGVIAAFASDQPHVLANARRAASAARTAGQPVIYVVGGFRPGAPEVHPNNAPFTALKLAGRLDPGPALDIHPELAPTLGDIIVTKRRVGPFQGTDLEMVLRAQGVTSLALCGVATGGIVLSAVRQAFDLDFRLTVVEDACADADADVHACLMRKVFPRHAAVMATDELVWNIAA